MSFVTFQVIFSSLVLMQFAHMHHFLSVCLNSIKTFAESIIGAKGVKLHHFGATYFMDRPCNDYAKTALSTWAPLGQNQGDTNFGIVIRQVRSKAF